MLLLLAVASRLPSAEQAMETQAFDGALVCVQLWARRQVEAESPAAINPYGIRDCFIIPCFRSIDPSCVLPSVRSNAQFNSIHKPLGQIPVRIDPPVAQKRPVGARGVDVGKVH